MYLKTKKNKAKSAGRKSASGSEAVPPREGFATRQEAAKFLRCSERKIDYMIDGGILEAVKMGRHRRVRCESLWQVALEGY